MSHAVWSYGNCQNQIIITSARDETKLLQIDCVLYVYLYKMFSLAILMYIRKYRKKEKLCFFFKCFLYISSQRCNCFEYLEICVHHEGEFKVIEFLSNSSLLPNSSLIYSIIYRWYTHLVTVKCIFYFPLNAHDSETMFKLLLE